MAGKRALIGTLLLLLTFVTPAFAAENAQGQADDKIYKISIAPYAWFTSMKGDLTVRGISTSVDVSFGDINDYIDFAGFVNTELSFYDKFGVIADVNYAAFSKEKRHKFVTLGGETSLFMTDLAAFYRVASIAGESSKTPRLDIDVLGGIKIWDVDLELNAQTPFGNKDFYGSRDWVDAYVGLRTNLHITDALSMRLRGTFGGWGDTKKAWDTGAYLGYSPTRWLTLLTGYKVVSVNRREDSGPDRFVFDMTVHGPVAGLMLNF